MKDIDIKGKKVLLRCDFNVPMAKDGSGVITDDKRIRAALPTIQYLLDQGGGDCLLPHGQALIGKERKDPDRGEVKLAELSLKPVGRPPERTAGQAGPHGGGRGGPRRPG